MTGLLAATAFVAAGAGPAAAMPKPNANVVVAVPQLQPLVPEAIPAEAFAVLRDDAGVPFRVLRRDQHERFYRASLSQTQQRPVGRIVVPVPPRFDACVHALRRGVDLGVTNEASSDAARRRVCGALREKARSDAASQILPLSSIVGEAGREGIAFTEARIHRERMHIARGQFDGVRGLRRFLAKSGYRSVDVRLKIIAQLAQTALVRKIQERLEAEPDAVEASEAQQRAIDTFSVTFRVGWHARTACALDFADLAACKAPAAG